MPCLGTPTRTSHHPPMPYSSSGSRGPNGILLPAWSCKKTGVITVPCKNKRRAKLWREAPGKFCGDIKVARAQGGGSCECLNVAHKVAPAWGACTCCQLVARLPGCQQVQAGLGPGDATPTGPRHTKQSISDLVGGIALAHASAGGGGGGSGGTAAGGAGPGRPQQHAVEAAGDAQVLRKRA